MSAVTEDLATPPRLRSPLFEGGFSMESLLASSLLHLAILFLAILFAPNPFKAHHDGVVIDIRNLTLPKSRVATAAQNPSTSGDVGRRDASPAEEAVRIPEKEPVSARPEEPAQQRRDDPQPEPTAPSASADAAAPEISPELAKLSNEGEYDPLQAYQAEVLQQLRDAIISSRGPAISLFAGYLVVHLWLDSSGQHVRPPELCPEETRVYPIGVPAHTAPRLWPVLSKEVALAALRAGSYPPAPTVVQMPDMMTYRVPLNLEP